ncbi:peptidoglycan-binding protein [Streptomyces kunmingensis]|uniref:Peptidoglycan-binding protein n=1 Tax=Streptomyces kunmingensis TaxID=68225 RepID=A0ABU6C741_9ACTN|nr:peptidoglycan-binding domain-containing protein [Streptomyces kunmingensis]MEB3960403.1 peptidoglycan-binding protein [Streptomyces kunmingensis]
MSGERRRKCPECGAGVGPDGGPACSCEADGFGPLRVRPYVTLPEPSQPPPPRVPDPYAHPPLPPEQPRATPDEPADYDDRPEDRPRRAPVLLLAAVAGVLSVAALVTVLISSGDGDTSATAQEATAPLTSTSAPQRPTPNRSAPSTRTTTPPPASQPASASASPTATPTPTRTPSHAPSPTRSAASPSTTPTRSQTRPPQTQESVLRRGDRGPQVAELQYRLRKLHLYADDPDGDFDSRTEYAVRAFQMSRGIRDDSPGTYGTATRQALERETR